MPDQMGSVTVESPSSVVENYQQTKTRNVIQGIVWVLGLGVFTAQLLGQTDLRWRDVTHELGIASPDRLPPSGHYLLTETFTGRAVPFDFDRDGDLDLFLTYGPHVADSLYSGLNRFYRHDDTAWVDVTAETGLARFPPAGNAAVGDVDGDGYPDLYLCLFGTDRLLRNENGRRWHDITDSAGIANNSWATDAVFFDANQDGYLDLYVANYLDYPREDAPVCLDAKTRQRITCDPTLYEPAPNRLFLNDSTGRFHEATEIMGLADTTSRSLAVKLLDANSDGHLDLFVLSHRSPNLLYLGGADSGLVEAGLFSGVALAPDGSEPEWSQVLTLDADQDGHTDLLFTRRDGGIQLLLNDGSGLFFEGHYQTGLFQPRFPYQATTAVALDVDFSGTTDLLLADTGYEHVRALPAVDTTEVDSAISAQDSSFFVQDSAFTATAVEPAVETRDEPSDPELDWPFGKAQDKPRRILLSDDEHRFYPAGVAPLMILDTTLIIPRVAPLAEGDTKLDFLEADTLGLLMFPLAPVGEAYNWFTFDQSEEPAPADTALGTPGPGEVAALPSSSSGSPDTALVDTAVAPIPTVPTAELPSYIELDTLRIFQEAERYVAVDLTGDGVEEIIATYPAGLFRVWKRELRGRPRFVGLWPGTGRAGTTAIGAGLTITGDGFSRRHLVTDPNPVVFYLPRRVWWVDIVVKWPDGLKNHYRTTLVNRTYTLTRIEMEP